MPKIKMKDRSEEDQQRIKQAQRSAVARYKTWLREQQDQSERVIWDYDRQFSVYLGKQSAFPSEDAGAGLTKRQYVRSQLLGPVIAKVGVLNANTVKNLMDNIDIVVDAVLADSQ